MHDSSPAHLSADPQQIARRLMLKAHNRDGLPEIAAGFCFLVASALIYAQVMTRPGSAAFDAANLAFAFLVPTLIFGLSKAITRVRGRYLIEREGYVKTRPARMKTILPGILVALAISMGLVAVVPRLTHPDQWLLCGTGVVIGAGAVFCGRAPRFVLLGFIAAATGVAVAWSGMNRDAGMTLLLAVIGLALLLSGSIVFVRFMRTPARD